MVDWNNLKDPEFYIPLAEGITWFDILQYYQDNNLPCPNICDSTTAKQTISFYLKQIYS